MHRELRVRADEQWARMNEIVAHAAAGRFPRDSLRELIAALSADRDDESASLLAFATAIARRDEELGDEANLYLKSFDVPQIELFELVATSLPPPVVASELVNDTLTRALAGEREATLVSLGCGVGAREAALLQRLDLERAHLFFVEPDGESLRRAEEAAREVAREKGMELRLRATAELAEALPESFFQEIASAPGPRAAMASFALHHMSDEPSQDTRFELFQRLHQSNVDIVSIAEPSSDHHVDCLLARYANARRHFGEVFRLIDEQSLDSERARALKLLFFGRELEDILGRDEGRVERHEPSERWIARVAGAGFRPARWLGELAEGDTRLLGPYALGVGGTDREPLVAVVTGVRQA